MTINLIISDLTKQRIVKHNDICISFFSIYFIHNRYEHYTFTK